MKKVLPQRVTDKGSVNLDERVVCDVFTWFTFYYMSLMTKEFTCS